MKKEICIGEKMTCPGCEMNILNQLAHVDGCLKSFTYYDLYVKQADSGKNEFLVSASVGDCVIFNRTIKQKSRDQYAYQTAVIAALDICYREHYIDTEEITVYVTSEHVKNVLGSGKVSNIPDYTFHLKFKEMGARIKVKNDI